MTNIEIILVRIGYCADAYCKTLHRAICSYLQLLSAVPPAAEDDFVFEDFCFAVANHLAAVPHPAMVAAVVPFCMGENEFA